MENCKHAQAQRAYDEAIAQIWKDFLKAKVSKA